VGPGGELIYIPAGRDSNVTVVHEDAPDTYTPAPGAPPPQPGVRGPRGPVIAAWFFAISH